MTIPMLFQDIADKNPDVVCQYSREELITIFSLSLIKKLYRIVEALAQSLSKEGIGRGDYID